VAAYLSHTAPVKWFMVTEKEPGEDWLISVGMDGMLIITQTEVGCAPCHYVMGHLTLAARLQIISLSFLDRLGPSYSAMMWVWPSCVLLKPGVKSIWELRQEKSSAST